MPCFASWSSSPPGSGGRTTLTVIRARLHARLPETHIAPDDYQAEVAQQARPLGGPEEALADDPRNLWCIPYGLKRFKDLFTNRQLTTITTFSGLVQEAKELACRDHASAEYADAIAVYLAFAVDKMCDTNTVLCTWQVDPPRLRATFGRQALPMTWDFAEANAFADAAGDFQRCVGSLTEVLDELPARGNGKVSQIDATAVVGPGRPAVFSTDPPYYDNIGYAGLSDFFYVWMRRSVKAIYPEVFGTLLVPKK